MSKKDLNEKIDNSFAKLIERIHFGDETVKEDLEKDIDDLFFLIKNTTATLEALLKYLGLDVEYKDVEGYTDDMEKSGLLEVNVVKKSNKK